MADTNDDGFERKAVFEWRPSVGDTGTKRERFESRKYTPWVHWGHRCRFWTMVIYQKDIIFKKDGKKASNNNIAMQICQAPTLRLKALNNHNDTHIVHRHGKCYQQYNKQKS